MFAVEQNQNRAQRGRFQSIAVELGFCQKVSKSDRWRPVTTSYSGRTDDISVRLHLHCWGAEAKLAFSLSLPG